MTPIQETTLNIVAFWVIVTILVALPGSIGALLWSAGLTSIGPSFVFVALIIVGIAYWTRPKNSNLQREQIDFQIRIIQQQIEKAKAAIAPAPPKIDEPQVLRPIKTPHR